MRHFTRDTIAVIDLGTNTFQLLLACADMHGHVKFLKRESVPVRLGEGISSGSISPAAFERGISTLQQFRRMMNHAGVTTTLAIATSATRSASNGAAFVEMAQHAAGIRIRVIDGLEEAELIHEGVCHALPLPATEPVLLMDIGGGSVEFIVSQGGIIQYKTSLNIGAARLLEAIKPSDPLTEMERAMLQAYLRQALAPVMRTISESYTIHRLIGSSSTFKALGMLHAQHTRTPMNRELLNGYTLDEADFDALYQILLHSTRAERIAMPGMKRTRVEMIVCASMMVAEVLHVLPDIRSITVSTAALREGILWQYLRQRNARIAN